MQWITCIKVRVHELGSSISDEHVQAVDLGFGKG